MKKKIAYILVAILIAVAGIGIGVGAFNNMNNNEPNTEVQGDGNEDNLSDEDLMKKAVAYVKTIYKDVAKETPADFERIGTVPVGKAKFTVDWSVDVDENIIKIVKQENGMVTIDINEEIGDETPYVLTATISDGKGNKETLTWDHVIPAKIAGSYQEIVDMAYALKNGESLPNVATLQGTVTTVNTPWDKGYKNITVTIAVEGREDKPIQCYRLKSGAADASQIEKGDLITVTGTLKNYNGTIEFDAGCILDENLKGQGKINKVSGTMQEIVDKAYALGKGEALKGEATLTGWIKSIDTPYSSQYDNITVTIVVEGRLSKPIQCYRLKGDNIKNLKVGDIITVTGNIKNFNGTIEFDAGCTLDKWEKGDGKAPETPVMSGSMQEIVDKAYKLAPGESFTEDAILTGKVTKVNTPWSSQYGNITVTIAVEGRESKPIKCYRLAGTNADKIQKGDTITVKGIITNYQGENKDTGEKYTEVEFKQGCQLIKWVQGVHEEVVLPDIPTVEGEKVVIWVPKYGKALSTKQSGGYNIGVDVVETNGVLDGYGDTEIFEMIDNGDGTYSFVQNDKRLSLNDGGYISLDEVNYQWKVEKLSDGLCNLKNVGTDKYVEWYAKYGNWSTYNPSWDVTTDDQFLLKIYYIPTSDTPEVPEESATLEDAKAALSLKAMTTSGYYSLLDSVTVKDTEFAVSWEAVVADEFKDVVKIVNGKLVIVASTESAVDYKLVATIANGTETTTKEFSFTVAEEWTAAEIFAAEDVSTIPNPVTLTGTITKVNEKYSEQYKNITVTMSVQIGDETTETIKCFRLKGEGADEIKVNDIIKVKGKVGEYDGALEFSSGCQLVDYATPEDITLVDQAYALTTESEALEDVSLSGIITGIKYPYDSGYGNISVYITTLTKEDKPILCYRMKGVGAPNLEVGDRITVTGDIVNYQNTIEFAQGCVIPLPETEEEIVDLAFTLVDGEKFYKDVTLNGEISAITDEYDSKYKNITVEMTVNGTKEEKVITCYRLTGEGVDKLAVGDKIVVTGTIKNYKGTIEFDTGCTLDFVLPRTEKEIVDLAFSSLTENNASLPIDVSLAGTISSIDYAYSSKNGNITVSIAVVGTNGQPKTIKCYKLIGDGIDKLAVGDLVRVYGTLTNYNGGIQFAPGCELEGYTEKDMVGIINSAYALAGGESLSGTKTLRGTIVSIDTPYDSGYGNITVTISFAGLEDKPIQCFRLKGVNASTLKVGDVITVSGTLKNYVKNENSTIEFDAGCQLVETMSGIISEINTAYTVENGYVTLTIKIGEEFIKCYKLTGSGIDKLAVGDAIRVTGPFVYYNDDKQFGAGSVLEGYTPKAIVDVVNTVYTLKKDESTEEEITLTGVVTEFVEYNTTYGNLTVIITYPGLEDKPITCYRIKGDGAANVKVGDTITVQGTITNYNGTIEFVQNSRLIPNPTTTESSSISQVSEVEATTKEEEE